MKDDNQLYNLSRRKVLGGLGAVGLASAGAGLGTSAYFNDTESFQDNSLTAGQLDLKIDWQQTYYGAYAWENDIAGGVPVNAYPDPNGDGMQDFNGVTYGGPGADSGSIDVLPGACCNCADDEYLLVFGNQSWCISPIRRDESVVDFYDYQETNDFSGNDAFTEEDTSSLFLYEDTGSGQLSLVLVHDDPETNDGGLADVTIWGYGDITPSWAVMDDDGTDASDRDSYVNGDPASADWVWASSHTDGGAINITSSDFTMLVDLAFGSAAQDSSEAPFDDLASIRKLRVLDGDGSGGFTDIVLTGPSGTPDDSDSLLGDVAPLTISSDCSIESGNDLPADVFSAPNRSETYGGPREQDHLVEISDVKPGDWGEITFSIHLCDNPGYVWMDALNLTENSGVLTEPENATAGGQGADLAEKINVTLWYDADCDNKVDGDETSLWSGTLHELFNSAGSPVTDGRRIPIDGDLADPSHDCMQPGGMCVGFKWEVPSSVENEIQGDSVAFDLGFYTEQCRHNDAPGASTPS